MRPAGLRIDNIYTIEDRGPYTRYTAKRYGCEYTLFLDDDILPDRDFVGQFIQCAQAKPDDLLGICGRRLPDGRYNYRGIARSETFQPVDMLVRLYWIPTRHIGRIGPFYAEWIAAGHSPILLDDDILMTWALWLGGAVLDHSQGRCDVPGIAGTPRDGKADAESFAVADPCLERMF